MIEVEESEELLTLRVRPRMPKTIDEEQGPRNHHQQGWQIHLAGEEICPKNRSHPSLPAPIHSTSLSSRAIVRQVLYNLI